MRHAHLDLLLSPINKLKGVGPKLENIINKLGIKLNVHFLWHFPYRIIEKKYYENQKSKLILKETASGWNITEVQKITSVELFEE